MSKTKTKYEIGDTVMVYEDPLTRERLEGRAIIQSHFTTDNYYYVVFIDGLQPEDATAYLRKVI